ncbi:MAG TPA: hypothetical protein VEC14_01080 [Reyranellaceae bacterium]|nr:hypothetical protein [Reyranellaceae bacterium]
MQIPVEQLQLLHQQDDRGVSKGDVVALPGGRIGIVQKLDRAARAVQVRRIEGTRAGVDKARSAFRSFSGAAPGAAMMIPAKMPSVVWLLGELDAVIYHTVRDGRREKYLHRFRQKARPALAVSFDGQQLVILGGGFQVTDRGIEG